MALIVRASRDGMSMKGVLEDIGDFVGRLCAGRSFELPLEASGDPRPYDELLRWIIVTVSDGLVVIRKDAETLRIEGAREYIANLGQHIESLLRDTQLPSHTHIEYYPGHFYLREDAEALVVGVMA